MKKTLLLVIFALMLIFGMSACTSDGLADPSFRTLRYEGGAGEGSKFKECVDVGEKLLTDDKYYPYPTTQRENVWDTANYNAGSNSADHPDLELTDQDGNTVNVKMKVSFFLNTSCDKVTVDTASGKRTFKGGVIQAFHEMIGKTRHAYFDQDGSYGDGWLWAMDNYISAPVTQFMTPRLRTLTAEKAWKNPEIAKNLAEELAEQLPELVNAGMETDLQFYQDFTVKIIAMTPDSEYLNIYKSRQNAKIAAETAALNRDQKVAEANANATIALAQAKIKRAEINAYPTVESYLKAQAIEKGMNPFQPNGTLLTER